jgi:hypothetical protein
VPARELAARRKKLKLRPPVFHRGVLAKYASMVSQAHLGAITDGYLGDQSDFITSMKRRRKNWSFSRKKARPASPMRSRVA